MRNPTGQTIIKAGWYGRVSSLGQVERGSSLETQKEQCEAMIKVRGWELAGAYVDAGISGARDDRPEFQRLLTDCRAGIIQGVVVPALDRLGRNAKTAIEVTDELERLGVAVVLIRENIDLGTPAGKLMRTVLAGVAEMERGNIRSRSIAGQRAKSARGLWPGGVPSYGWRLDGKGKDSRPVPDEQERQTLGVMVAGILAGHSTGQVARDLNEQGTPSRTGAAWSHAVVRAILRNESLTTGEHHWGFIGVDIKGRHHKTAVGRDGQPQHGEPIIIELPEPPLDQATFDAVQATLDRAPRSGRKQDNQQTQLLTGRIYGPCGRHYLGQVVTNRAGTSRPAYRPQCKRRPKPGQGPCECKQLDGASVDAQVWGEVAAILSDRDRLLKLAEAWVQQGTPSQVDRGEVQKLEGQATKFTRAIERAKDAAFLEDDPSELLARVARYRSELVTVRQRLDSLQSLAPKARERSGRLREMASLADRAAQRLESMTPGQRAELVALLDLRVEVAGAVVDGVPAMVHIRGVLDPRLGYPMK